jgi:transcriptional regulator with XRE-family HTH domain
VAKDAFREAVGVEVAHLLREERMKRGLSLNVVAQRAGLARQTISYVEKVVQSPSLDTLLRIADVLGTDLEKIIAKARRRAMKSV